MATVRHFGVTSDIFDLRGICMHRNTIKLYLFPSSLTIDRCTCSTHHTLSNGCSLPTMFVQGVTVVSTGTHHTKLKHLWNPAPIEPLVDSIQQFPSFKNQQAPS